MVNYIGTDETWGTIRAKLNAIYGGGVIDLSISGNRYGVLQEGLAGDPDINAAVFQSALDDAASLASTMKSVRLPPGRYITSRIVVPEGVTLFSMGHIETTSKAVTRLIQSPSGGDVIRVTGHIDPANGRRFFYGNIFGFSIFGYKTVDAGASVTTGRGIAFYDADGNTVCPQDTTYIHDMTIRGMPEEGLLFPDGGIPVKLARIKTWYNGAAGLRILGGSSAHQSIDLDNITGDRNIGGLIVLENLDAKGNVVIRNFKSEMAINTLYGNVDAQLNAIVIKNPSSGSVITVLGGTHVSAIPDGLYFKKPGDIIKLEGGSTPHIDWVGLQARISTVNDTGTDPNVISDGVNVSVPYTVKSGCLSNAPLAFRSNNGSKKVTLGNINSVIGASGLDNGLQIAGSNPFSGYYESDASADDRRWLEYVNGAALIRATENNAGTQVPYWVERRSSNAVTQIESVPPILHKALTKTALLALSPATYSGYFTKISNPAGGKGYGVHSSGSAWLYDSDDSAVV
jgi:hypothetical protein